MHKKIEEIAGQAVEEMDQEAFSEDMYIPDEYLEKFAELIIRECIEQASIGNLHDNNQWDKALTFAADNIKNHFGVE